MIPTPKMHMCRVCFAPYAVCAYVYLCVLWSLGQVNSALGCGVGSQLWVLADGDGVQRGFADAGTTIMDTQKHLAVWIWAQDIWCGTNTHAHMLFAIASFVRQNSFSYWLVMI